MITIKNFGDSIFGFGLSNVDELLSKVHEIKTLAMFVHLKMTLEPFVFQIYCSTLYMGRPPNKFDFMSDFKATFFLIHMNR